MEQKTAFILPVQIQAIVIRPPVRLKIPAGKVRRFWGQSMTESATYGRALIEVDPAGNTYATIRMQLMDNIENPQFQVDGSPVSATLMQEDYSSNTADYRFRINSENSVVRVNMYVTAMGRDIIYYITFSGLSEGAGDFITSVTVEEKGGSAGRTAQRVAVKKATREKAVQESAV